MTAECGYFDTGDLTNEPCHIGILNTAENIFQIIKEQNLLVEAFKNNPVIYQHLKNKKTISHLINPPAILINRTIT